MAWPATPLTTYVANTVPAIKAADFNAFQNGINGIVNGAYSLKGLLIDGTGGVMSTPPAGSIRVSREVTGFSTPNIVVPQGEINVGQTVVGVAYILSNGSLLKGVNVKTVSRRVMGEYTITWNLDIPGDGSAYLCALATVDGVPGGVASCEARGGSPSQLKVYTGTFAGVPADRNFSVAVFGR